MRELKIMLAALSIIGVLASTARADPGPGESKWAAATGVAWIGEGRERDRGAPTPGPTDPDGPVR